MENKSTKILTKNIIELMNKLGDLEIDNVEIRAEELVLFFQPIISSLVQPPQSVSRVVEEEIQTLIEADFAPPIEVYSGEIAEVQIGATKSEGGSRNKVIKIGGSRTMPFYSFEFQNKNRPALAMDVFDVPIKMAKPVKQHFKEVMDDPSDWAKKCVEDFDADIVSLNLISTDPLLKDTSPKAASKTVEQVLQAVDVPLIIGGSGNKVKDPLVLEAAAEIACGEKCILNSANVDNDYKKIVQVANKYDHSVIAFTPMDINNQKKLNKYLLDEGLPKNKLIMDPTTAALGYGLDYSVSLMERIKLAGLLGDTDLQMPIVAPSSNAWGARESWMKYEEWGPREYRGPLWEAITTITLMMSGGDLFMLSHPATVKVVKRLIKTFFEDIKTDVVQNISHWITKLEK